MNVENVQHLQSNTVQESEAINKKKKDVKETIQYTLTRTFTKQNKNTNTV